MKYQRAFIFAGSVFTHIKDMSAAWALELARCLSADGLAIYTVTTELSIDTLRKVAAADTQKTKKVPQFVVDNNIDAEHLRKRGFITTQTSPWWLATLYHTEFFRRRLEIAYDVVAVVPSLKGYQTGFVVRLRRDYYSQ